MSKIDFIKGAARACAAFGTPLDKEAADLWDPETGRVFDPAAGTRALNQGVATAPQAPKPKFTMADLMAAKQKMVSQGIAVQGIQPPHLAARPSAPVAAPPAARPPAPVAAPVPPTLRPVAVKKAQEDAFRAFGVKEAAGTGILGTGAKMLGKGMQLGGKLLGTIPGPGTLGGAAVGAAGGALVGAVTAPQGQRLKHMGIGAVSGGVGGALGPIAGAVADPVINMGLNKMVG